MRYSLFALPLAGVLLIGACSQPGQFDAGGAGGGPGAGGELVGPGPQDISDPRSPAYFSATIGDRVFFAVDESTLSAAARSTLQGQARWLNDNTDFNVEIQGHADEQGTREYNIALSARRASAVQQYLVAEGVAASRLRTVPFGKERPVELCSEESCYSKNRRAVTVLAAGAGV